MSTAMAIPGSNCLFSLSSCWSEKAPSSSWPSQHNQNRAAFGQQIQGFWMNPSNSRVYICTNTCLYSALWREVPWNLVSAEPVALWKSSLSLTFIILRLSSKPPGCPISPEWPHGAKGLEHLEGIRQSIKCRIQPNASHLACRKHRDFPWLYQLVTLTPVWNRLEGAQPCAEPRPWASLRLAATVPRGAEFSSHPQFPAEVSGPLIHWTLINNTLNLKGFCIFEPLIFKKDILHFLCDWEGGWLSSRSWQTVTSM